MTSAVLIRAMIQRRNMSAFWKTWIGADMYDYDRRRRVGTLLSSYEAVVESDFQRPTWRMGEHQLESAVLRLEQGLISYDHDNPRQSTCLMCHNSETSQARSTRLATPLIFLARFPTTFAPENSSKRLAYMQQVPISVPRRCGCETYGKSTLARETGEVEAGHVKHGPHRVERLYKKVNQLCCKSACL